MAFDAYTYAKEKFAALGIDTDHAGEDGGAILNAQEQCGHQRNEDGLVGKVGNIQGKDVVRREEGITNGEEQGIAEQRQIIALVDGLLLFQSGHAGHIFVDFNIH